jgi:hypothetical protein
MPIEKDEQRTYRQDDLLVRRFGPGLLVLIVTVLRTLAGGLSEVTDRRRQK